MFIYHVLVATALRLLLVSSGTAGGLVSRFELSTPLSRLHQLRECGWLWDSGAPPYSGSACHTAPLIAALAAPLALAGPFAYIALNAAADATAALLLRDVASKLLDRSRSPALSGAATGCVPALQHVCSYALLLNASTLMLSQKAASRYIVCMLCRFLHANALH